MMKMARLQNLWPRENLGLAESEEVEDIVSKMFIRELIKELREEE